VSHSGDRRVEAGGKEQRVYVEQGLRRSALDVGELAEVRRQTPKRVEVAIKKCIACINCW
jgi:hypothetical protein